MQRVETVTVVDFLAMCGGVLGLFMGFSAVTVVELIYYPFLRLFWMIRRLKTENDEQKSKEGAKADSETSIDTEKRAHSVSNVKYCEISNSLLFDFHSFAERMEDSIEKFSYRIL